MRALAARSQTKVILFRFLSFGLVLASAGAQFAVVPVLPDYAHQLGLSGLQQGLVLGATGLASLAVSLPAGLLADRFGARKLTLSAGTLMALAMLVQALAVSFAPLLIARLIFGVGYAVTWTAGLSWLAEAAPDGRGLSGSVACAGIGGVAGPAVAGVLVQYFGLASPCIAMAACFIVLTGGLAFFRTKLGMPAPTAPMGKSLRNATSDRKTLAAAAAIVTAGATTGISALLVPSQLHAEGASPGRIGLDFAIAGMVFVAGSALTAQAGRRAIRSSVLLAAMLALALAFSPAAITSAPIAIVAMLCATTAARSVLWTVSYPLAAEGAERSGAGMGVVMGLLNGVWALTVVVGPLVAGLAAKVASPQAVFGLTAATCVAVFAVAISAASPWRRSARTARAAASVYGAPGDGVRIRPEAVRRSSARAGAGCAATDEDRLRHPQRRLVEGRMLERRLGQALARRQHHNAVPASRPERSMRLLHPRRAGIDRAGLAVSSTRRRGQHDSVGPGQRT